ncbi:MAG: SIR2 family protein [Candidatus Hodarchaeota archaeon]
MSTNIDNFIDDLAKRDFIVFAGAGVVGETGVSPSWKRLLEKFKGDEPESVEENLEEIDESEYPRVAQNIFERLRLANKEHRYYEVLRNSLFATNAPHSAHEIDIVTTAKHVITTNFDDTFESALKFVLEEKEGCTRVVQSLPDLGFDALSKEYSVSYLHGRVNEHCIVLREDDYRAFYPSQFGRNGGSDVLEVFLRNVYGERTIVFVGFGFRDRYFLGALQKIRSDIERNDAEGKKQKPSYSPRIKCIQHYACLQEFCRAAEEKALREKYKDKGEKEIEAIMAEKERQDEELTGVLGEIGIIVLRYRDHREWMDWFKRIRENRKAIQTVKFK